jgi:predicted RNase H-like HicB family nuclease
MKSVYVAFEWDPDIAVFTAHIPHVAAYGEGATKEEALQSLKQAITLYIEEVGKQRFEEEVTPAEYQKLDLATLA